MAPKQRTRRINLPFVGVDGEGGDIADEYGFTTHTYTMLRAGNQYVTSNYLHFLATLPRGHIYVAFSFDYDVTMICRDMPEHLQRVLVSGQPVRWGEYELSYRPKKELIIKWRRHYVVINDVFSFFQSTFLTALKRWGIGTPEQHAIIEGGKEGRARFGPLTVETISYNWMECLLLAELMEKFRRTCIVLGYLPRRWQGPGQLAKAMLAHHKVPKTKDLPEPNLAGIWEAAQAAYYGGRFETSAVGPIKTPVDNWDLNSAYPAAITQLPCLSHGTWRPSRTIEPGGIYHIQYNGRGGQPWYGFPHRTSDGRIIFPQTGAGWYWGEEIIAAQHLGMKVTVTHGFHFAPNCEHRLFDFVPRVYSLRQALGKSEAGMALKLALNSLYGVFAQSIGDPPYANPIYAGRITAITRAKLLEAISHDPWSVYMVATDGIYAAPGLPLTPSDNLGEWDLKHYPDGMHIVMPGVYFAGDSGTVRTRGVPASAIKRERARLTAAYQGHYEDGIEVSLRQFLGLRISVHRGRQELAGQWVEVSKRVGYDWRSKRRPNVLRRINGIDRTLPYETPAEPESTPYSRFIGGNLIRDMDRLEFSDMPEWAENFTELA